MQKISIAHCCKFSQLPTGYKISKAKFFITLVLGMIILVQASSAQSPDRDAAIELAEAGVASNEAWTPYGEVLNEVEMVLVPKGCFMMGSEAGEDNEQPAHEQCLDAPFWIDKTEVTRAMYQVCVDDGACTEATANDYSIRDTQPINFVTGFQASEYCAWREARLPTEREWEYAARGPNSWVYPWGDEFVANNVVYKENSDLETADVGSREMGASWVGALDMSGNVEEWVNTLFMDYPYDVADGREDNQERNKMRVLRGGSYFTSESSVRAAYRHPSAFGAEISFIGFRCARDYEG